MLFEKLVEEIYPQSKLLRYWTLQGGVSAQVTALEIEQPDGQQKRLVVRQHGAADLAQNPNIAVDEFTLLHHLKSAGLPVPTPYFADNVCIVVEFIDGATEFTPDVHQLAAQLVRIHSVEPLPFLPSKTLNPRPAVMDEALDEGRIRDVLDSVWPLPQVNKPVLLHGDYWPGNVMWKDGRIAAVIDWEDAAVGDPLMDVANARLELLWAAGVEAMETFTAHYQQLMPDLDFTHLPYWDLFAALKPMGRLHEWAGDAVTEQKMRDGHRLFVSRAFERLVV